jgi:negative regulator of sigma E activity
VIERYLTAENEAQQDESEALAITPANYKFQYKGQNQIEGRTIHVFQVTPKKKLRGLFKGEVWIDAATYLPVQESGYLIKSPSIFVKKVAFVRKFEIRDGVSVPLQVQSTVDTRLFGKAELTVDFTNFSLDDGDTDNR